MTSLAAVLYFLLGFIFALRAKNETQEKGQYLAAAHPELDEGGRQSSA